MRQVDFSDGFTSGTPPTQGTISASAAQTFASDAAFVTAKGSAAAGGDFYYNTATDALRFYNDAIADWQDVDQEASASLPGIVTIGAQTIAGSKTFTGAVTRVDEALATTKRDESSGATVNALDVQNTLVKLSATVTTLNGATAGGDGQRLVVYNATGGIVTVNHESGSASAANRFTLPAAAAITLADDTAVEFLYDTTTARWIAIATGNGASALVQRGYIAGLGLSNNVGDANNDIDIAVGDATDSSVTYLMRLSSALTKRLDATWVVGTNQGGLDTGAKANSTWYHVWLIRKDSDASIDVLFSTSVSSPSMPSGYTAKRRIGSIRTDGSGNILAFSQFGDYFAWSASILDIDATNPGTSAVSATLTVPTGVKVDSIFNLSGTAGAGATVIHISDLAASDEAPGTASAPLGAWRLAASETNLRGRLHCMTNTSGQIRYRVSASDGSTLVKIATLGWNDYRGKND